ncbi:MAG: DUF1460 domain-containing protein [Bacteroidetes bacterium QS_9_68_14]|nr:MAG: DUF1460 domain-containing protein [Bacteroidetes bacterium QS_9_68_14]
MLLGGLVATLIAASGCAGDPAPSGAGSTATGQDVTQGPSPSAPTMPPRDSVDVADIPPDSATRARFQAVMQQAKEQDLAERPAGEVVQALGQQFLGRPYLKGPLDQTLGQDPPEQLVCRLDGFDCFTFDEAVLAMARAVKSGSPTYDQYKDYTRRLRYRDGEIGYCNRMHYYTAFVRQAEEQGVLRNVTEEIGGRRRPGFQYGFMSAHRGEYPQLESDSLYRCIQQVEQRLSRTMRYRFIPQDSIRAVYPKLKAGDLISTSTDIDGLDVTHTGLVYKSTSGGESDTTGLLHASTSGGVKISPDLQAYVQGVDSQTGIIVARPVFGEGSADGSASESNTSASSNTGGGY